MIVVVVVHNTTRTTFLFYFNSLCWHLICIRAVQFSFKLLFYSFVIRSPGPGSNIVRVLAILILCFRTLSIKTLFHFIQPKEEEFLAASTSILHKHHHHICRCRAIFQHCSLRREETPPDTVSVALVCVCSTSSEIKQKTVFYNIARDKLSPTQPITLCSTLKNINNIGLSARAAPVLDGMLAFYMVLNYHFRIVCVSVKCRCAQRVYVPSIM